MATLVLIRNPVTILAIGFTNPDKLHDDLLIFKSLTINIKINKLRPCLGLSTMVYQYSCKFQQTSICYCIDLWIHIITCTNCVLYYRVQCMDKEVYYNDNMYVTEKSRSWSGDIRLRRGLLFRC